MKKYNWKKQIIVVATIIVLSISLIALAEVIDTSTMSDDEIIVLYEQLAQEIVNRRISKTAELPAGTYYVGDDLPAGKYTLTCMATGDDWGNVTIYSDRGEGKQKEWHVMSAPEEGEKPESCVCTLVDGDRLKSDVPFSLTVFVGAQFK